MESRAKRFREVFQTNRPQNRVRPPRALMSHVHGEDSVIDAVKFGEPIVIEGRDLTLLDATDFLSVWMNDAQHRPCRVRFNSYNVMVNSPDEMKIPFPEEFMRMDVPEDAALYFELYSRGGKATGKHRLTRYRHAVKVVKKE